ncbi:uncharacterized protein LOC135307972 isoform X2 [Passer domesticus]|uniref:uncharacterized protein LOC135307972 isoform X2 n=1 Tax=Passer domesticus TaxID=48849 RepID=UPI0030FED4A0
MFRPFIIGCTPASWSRLGWRSLETLKHSGLCPDSGPSFLLRLLADHCCLLLRRCPDAPGASGQCPPAVSCCATARPVQPPPPPGGVEKKPRTATRQFWRPTWGTGQPRTPRQEVSGQQAGFALPAWFIGCSVDVKTTLSVSRPRCRGVAPDRDGIGSFCTPESVPGEVPSLGVLSQSALVRGLQLVESVKIMDSQCHLAMVAPQAPVGPFFIMISLLLMIHPADPWIVPQPKANVWRTLAQAMGQDHLCLSTASAADPLSTCLVGIPFGLDDFPPPLLPHLKHLFPEFDPVGSINPSYWWEKIMKLLNYTTDEPTEFELLGSARASLCLHFLPHQGAIPDRVVHFKNERYQTKNWCNFTTTVYVPNTFYLKPALLPKGAFLICGNRAWAGIPPRLSGGPCTFGRLTLLTPNYTQILNWKRKNVTQDLARVKRDTHKIDPECDTEIVHWSRPRNIAVSVFLPWVAAAKALGELGNLECWVAKQANLTSTALADLLADEETTRKATLQNRAAIDFLLLLHNHHCEEFAGLCCMNLSSRAEDARHTIRQMSEDVNNIRQQTSDWLGDWLSKMGVTGWVGSIIRTILVIIFVLLCLIFGFCIIYKLLTRILFASTPQINHVEAPADPAPIPEELSCEKTHWEQAPQSSLWFSVTTPV